MSEGHELVGVLSHRRYDSDDARAGFLRGDEALGDAADLLGVGDRGASELHHEGPGARRRRGGLHLGNGFVDRLGHGVILGSTPGGP